MAFELPNLPYAYTALEPKTEKSEYPKVMWVWNYKNEMPLKRVVFANKNNKYIAWYDAETLKEAETRNETKSWYFAKDINSEQ
jgi:hypothetical protein